MVSTQTALVPPHGGEGGTRADLRITVALKCWSGAAKRQAGLFA